MIRSAIVSIALIAGLLTPANVAAAPAFSTQEQSAAPLTAADAAEFIGEWILALNGPDRSGTFELTVKVEKEKVVGEITPQTLPTQSITDVTKADKRLVLRYSFDYEGNRVDAVVELTPGADGKTSAQIGFAAGAYVMTGSATKKEKAK